MVGGVADPLRVPGSAEKPRLKLERALAGLARVIGCTEANTYDLVDNKALVLTSASLKYIEEVLA